MFMKLITDALCVALILSGGILLAHGLTQADHAITVTALLVVLLGICKLTNIIKF